MLKIVAWSYNCLKRIIIIINSLKPYNCMQKNDSYYLVGIIIWNHVIMNINILWYVQKTMTKEWKEKSYKEEKKTITKKWGGKIREKKSKKKEENNTKRITNPFRYFPPFCVCVCVCVCVFSSTTDHLSRFHCAVCFLSRCSLTKRDRKKNFFFRTRDVRLDFKLF